MQVRSDRRYPFPVEPAALWTAISATSQYQRWWPWLRTFEGGGFEEGATWRCTVQPPLPYALRFCVTLVEVDAGRRVLATVAGDIDGTARLDIEAQPGGCAARLQSALAPRSRVLRSFALAARPLVRFGHDWVLDSGARQFRHHAL